MNLPKQYQWLNNEPGPLMLKEAINLFGVLELPSSKNSPTIMGWAKELGQDIEKIYYADEVPWCGFFMAVVARRAKKQLVKDPLWALNWGTFGQYVTQPMLGDVLVFTRTTPDGKKAGHVAMYIGEDTSCYHILGGNQNDSVCIARKDKTLLYAARRPNYTVQPANVRLIHLQADGAVLHSEQ